MKKGEKRKKSLVNMNKHKERKDVNAIDENDFDDFVWMSFIYFYLQKILKQPVNFIKIYRFQI